MTKNEFLSIIRGRITGRIPTREVESQIDYYSAYIDGRIGAGLTEEEAVAELGDPQLIAKTVIESIDRAAEAAGYDGRYRSSTDTYDDSDGINSGIFGNSGPRKEAFQEAEASYSNGREAYSDGGSESRSADRKRTSSGLNLGCIVAVIVLVLVMILGWILTTFVFAVSIHFIGWLFPLIAAGGIGLLIFNMVRRR